MRVLLSIGLAVLTLFAVDSALAGPNAGGMLVAHDVGIEYTADGGAPWPSQTPTCPSHKPRPPWRSCG